jgi:hypothetical protein
MATKQGDLALLNHLVAQELLHSQIPVRLAYNWSDGTPRVVPIWFHWTGTQVVMASPTLAPKSRALKTGAKVALTIDDVTPPWKVLLIRGTAEVTVVDGVDPDYALAAVRYLGREQAQAWLDEFSQMARQMTRVAVTPEWVGVIDTRTRFPSALEKAREATSGGAAPGAV